MGVRQRALNYSLYRVIMLCYSLNSLNYVIQCSVGCARCNSCAVPKKITFNKIGTVELEIK